MKTADITVNYVEHMGSDLSVVNAARQSFAKQKTVFDPVADGNLVQFLATGKRTKEWDEFLDEIETLVTFIQKGATPEADRETLKQRLIAYKREAQHWAPFGHPHVTLRLRMPIFLARQFVKHQVGGVWSEESRRYIADEPEFYIEPVLMGRPDDIKQGAAGALPGREQEDAKEFVQAVTADAVGGYLDLLNEYKVAPEQAREILTLNTMTGVTWTGSLLFWSRVCNQRLDAHAQGAARAMAKLISDIVGPLYPVSWEALTGVKCR